MQRPLACIYCSMHVSSAVQVNFHPPKKKKNHQKCAKENAVRVGTCTQPNAV